MTDEIQVPPPPAPEPQPESTPFGAGVPVEPVEAVRLSPSERRGPSIEVQAQSTPWVPPSPPPAAPVQPAPAYASAAPTWSGAAAAAAPAASTAGFAAAGAAAAPGYAPPPPSAPDAPTAASKAASRSRRWVAACHISYLIPLNLPGIIFTTLVWIWRRDRDPLIADQGREALNMQLTYWLVILLLTMTVFASPLIPFVWFLGAILSVLAAIAASNGERYRYPFIWRILA